MNRISAFLLGLTLPIISIASGCTSYAAPGKAADMRLFKVSSEEMQGSDPDTPIDDPDILSLMQRKPASPLPVRLVMVRLQAPDYESYTIHRSPRWSESASQDRFSVITVRDVETKEDYERIQKFPQIAYLGTLNRLLAQGPMRDEKDLRMAAASMQSDMILVYTVDTLFQSEDQATPLSVVTLGLSPTVVVHMNTTVSAVLMDTRTGYIYGAAEAPDSQKQAAAWWTNQNAIDQARRRTERNAFVKMIDEFEKTWASVIQIRKKDLNQF